MTNSFYLGPTQKVVPLGSWEDLVSAAAAGVLAETHWVELKQAVPAKPGANLELAKDLASLSLDGGVLLIGLTDPKDSPSVVVGTELAGLETRVSQVACGSIHPPLAITTSVVPHPDEPAKAVLVVSVPASLTAPHMVDDRYWGRSNEGKQTLSDPLVRMVLAAQEGTRQQFGARFAQTRAELNPFPADTRKNSHLHLLLEPARTAVEHKVRDVIKDDLLLYFLNTAPAGGSQAPPTIGHLGWATAHPDGTLLSNGDIDEMNGALRVLVRDDGAVAVFSSRASREEIVIPGHVATLTHQIIVTAGRLARDHLGFNGQWQIGVLVDNLQDRRPQRDDLYGVRYPQAEYRRVITTTTTDMAEDAPAVTSSLLSGFFRGVRWPESYSTLQDLARP